jgi:hypothetical protein
MSVFVDDITLACKDGAQIDLVIQELSSHFKLHVMVSLSHDDQKSTTRDHGKFKPFQAIKPNINKQEHSYINT